MSLSTLCRLPESEKKVKSIVKILIVLIVILCPEHIAWSQDLDSLKQKALSDKLDEYFMAIEREGTQVQKQESDFLIESASDSLVRQFIAMKIYDHYLNSPVMGSEAVAIHVLDRWFIPGTVKMKSDIDFINAQVYADFNRHSLVGMKAPQLSMQDIDGQEVSLFGGEGSSVESNDGSRFSVMYFYDTDCSKCRMESILLRNLLEDRNYPLDLYAVYSGDDRKAWEEYASRQLKIEAENTNVVNLWDPGLDSDFQRKYGVLQTPRMFLISPDGTILGRGLDTEALMQMLRSIYTKTELTYGSHESERLFDNILASEDGTINPTAERVAKLSDYIKDSTLPQGDTTMFRQLSGDLLYYLASRSGEGFKEGLKHLIDNNVKAFPKAWSSPDDSLKIVGFAQIMDDLLSKAVPGTLIPDTKIEGERISKGKTKTGSFSLRKLKGATNVIVFYTEGCEVCKAEKAALRELAASDKSLRLFFVNVDEIVASYPEKSGMLFDSFDLSALPCIVMTDRKGIIQRRYLSYR